MVAKMAVDRPADNAIPPPAPVGVNSGKAKGIAKATFTKGKLGNFEPRDPPPVNAPGEVVCAVNRCVCACVCVCACTSSVSVCVCVYLCLSL